MKYKDKHIKQIEKFVDYIKHNIAVETTVKYLTENFFNGNKEFFHDSTKRLKEAGVLMTDKSWYKGKGQKWFYLENNVNIPLLFQVTVNKVPVDKVPVYEVPVDKVPEPEIINTNNGWFIIEKKHYSTFKHCYKITKSTFGSVWKKAVIEECLVNGLSAEQANYLWSKYEKYKSKKFETKD